MDNSICVLMIIAKHQRKDQNLIACLVFDTQLSNNVTETIFFEGKSR